MIVSRTPFRISFFGGGTDYEPWYSANGGTVLSTTINRYCYLSCRYRPPFFDTRNRIVWSKIENVNEYDEIVHPVVREVLRLLNIQGVEIHHDGDLPSRAGLGSSSSFTVGILHALNGLLGNISTKKELANTAIHVEKEILRENVGIQDQIAAAYGGFNRIRIGLDGSYEIEPMTLKADRLEALQSRLVLVYTGISRVASEIAGDSIKSIPSKALELQRMQEMVSEAVNILRSPGDLDEFGRLLDEAWRLKRSLNRKIAPQLIDQVYDVAKGAGALGGKLLGAGGGGFMVFYVPPDRKSQVLAALEKLLVVPFKFENQGSQIIFYDPDELPNYSASGSGKQYESVDAGTGQRPLKSGSMT